MAWKKKEKELTEKEAIQQAKLDLAPLWYRTSPLLVPIVTPESEDSGGSAPGTEIFPLEPSFNQSHWMLCFSDPTTIVGQSALHIIREWHARYSPYQYRTLALQESDFPIQKKRLFLERVSEEFRLTMPLALDENRALARGFGVTKLSSIRLLVQGSDPLVSGTRHRACPDRVAHSIIFASA